MLTHACISCNCRRAFPLHELRAEALARPPVGAVQAVWGGHASMLVQMDGVTFLTDPALSARCSPSQRVGPQRVVRTALAS